MMLTGPWIGVAAVPGARSDEETVLLGSAYDTPRFDPV